MNTYASKLFLIEFRDFAILRSKNRVAHWTLPLLVTLVGMIGSYSSGQDHAIVAPSKTIRLEQLPRRVSSAHIPNLVQVHADVYSGGQPDGEAAFKELRSMGVQTIISVDGVTPDVEAAESNQLRYVHLPHGYDGISDSRMLELAKAIRVLPKPIYIHCHHGKHRSPTAASAACLLAGLINESDAHTVLKIAGTGKNYVGLFATIERTKFDPKRDWSKVKVDFQAIASITPMTRSMVSIEHYWSRIQAATQSDLSVNDSRQSDKKRSGTDHDFLMLKELYVELTRDSRAINDIVFAKYLTDGINIIGKINLQNPEAPKELEQNCKACHQVYRDALERKTR
ncbi:MAG: hypothetical protein NTW52_17950 [Planctomycetota bacterium]|nr:hypothetical protein [Planctomycetota bacterium]